MHRHAAIQAGLLASLLAGAPLSAQVTVPQVKDNRQPSLALTHFIDAAGFVRLSGSSFVPQGWAPLDGRLIAAAASPNYRTQVGTTWGGDGTTTVGLPDVIGRTIAGAGDGLQFGSVHGSREMTITTPNLPASQGGSAQPIDNRQQGLTMRYAVRTEGSFPNFDAPYNRLETIGAVAAFTGSVLPQGWALAEGQLLSIEENYGLFTALGTSFGGDGATTFKLPDLRGRVPIGTGDLIQIGEKAGVAATVLTDLNVPSVLGGIGAPFFNLQPTLGLHFAVNLSGIFPQAGADGAPCPCSFNDIDNFIGEVNMYAWLTPPLSRALGQILPINQNQALSFLYGTSFGGGGTNFMLPNMAGRVVVGAGTSVVDASRNLSVGARVGVASHLLDGTPTSLVPEPSTYALLAGGLAGLGAVSRLRRTRG